MRSRGFLDLQVVPFEVPCPKDIKKLLFILVNIYVHPYDATFLVFERDCLMKTKLGIAIYCRYQLK